MTKTNNNEEDILLAIKRAVHDLNNIFTSNLVSIEQLKKLSSNDKTTRNLLTNLNNNSLRAIDIINSITPDSKKVKRPVSLSDVINDVESTVRASLPNNVKLKISLEEKLPKIKGYYTDLYRAFLNLIVNALESIEDSGTIEVTAKNNTSNNSINIIISDTGKGIPKELISSIFNVGFSSKTTDKESGHGLAIVKSIIEKHSGSISVTSKLNEGTEFDIFLHASSVQLKNDTTNKAKKILIVDDDKTILELFSDLLSSYNYNVIPVNSAEKAYNVFIKSSDIDLIIVDKVMPDIDGLELIMRVRNKNQTLPIILTTGSQEVIEKDLTHLGINKKIKKPYNFEDILSEIQKTLN